MSDFDSYFWRVFKGTYLSKRERQVWQEEMQGHLEEAIESGIESGLHREEAYESALVSFGSAKAVRRRLIRETFGVSPNWFLISSSLCLALFITSLFVQMRVSDIIPTTMQQLPTPRWVLVWANNPLLSQIQAWLGLAVALFMLIYTRKRSDRVALFLSLTPFFVVWVIVKVTHQYALSSMMFADYPMREPFGAAELAGYLLILIACLASYMWSRNRTVALTPWILSIGLTVWPILRDTVQTALWHITNNPIFWGHGYPDSYFLGWSILTILVRFIILGSVLYGIRRIDAMRQSRVHVA